MERAADTSPIVELPRSADGARQIIDELRAAGFQALLAGGCVRDLLLGRTPKDFDVATDASPQQIRGLFRPTRHVGAQFGVVLAQREQRWIEVATFRSDGPYLDGRRPTSVTFGDARQDALRRDFTINGMFLDPQTRAVIDHVGGRADLAARVLRAIGDPAARFAEDHLRLLRAVRFAALLDFSIEPGTLEAIRSASPKLARVAPERVRDELERMLAAATRAAAWRMLVETGLASQLWPGAAWSAAEACEIASLLANLPPGARFETSFSILTAGQPPREVERIARRLAFSNEQRRDTLWLVANQSALDHPLQLSLAKLKRLMAEPAFNDLRDRLIAREGASGERSRLQQLDTRLRAIPPHAVAPAPLVSGADLITCGVRPGPAFKRILHELYTRQLDEELATRAAALAALNEALERAQSHRIDDTPR